MYNSLEVGYNNDAVSQLRELEIRLDQEGYEREYIYLLQDVSEELRDFREMNLTVEDVLDAVHSLSLEDWIEIKQDGDARMQLHMTVEELEERRNPLDTLIKWQTYNKEQLKEELRKLELPINGNKNQLFERLVRTLNI